MVSGTNPFRHFALRNATSPEGGGLGKEGKFRPHPSTAGRSQPISGKLYVPAKASPFRERWHGGAVTERVGFRKNPLRLAAAFRKRFLNRSRGKIGKSVCAAGTPPDFVPATSAERVGFRKNPLRLAAAFRKRFLNRSRGKIGKSVCAAGTPPDFVPATSAFGSRVEPWSCLPRIESSGRFSGSLLARKREHLLSHPLARRSRDGEGCSPLKLPHRGRISRTVSVSPSTENRTSKAPNSMP